MAYKITKILLFLAVLLTPLYVVRFYIGSYPSTLLEFFIVLTVVSWVVERGIKGLRGINAPIAIFLTAAAVSVIVSPDKRGALGMFKAYFVEPILIFFIIKDIIRTKEDWWQLWGVLGVSGLWVALLAIFQGLTGQLTFAPHEAALGRSHAVYNTANAVGLYVGPIVFLALGAVKGLKGIKGVKEAARVFGIGLMVLAIIFSQSSGAMGGLGVGLGVWGMFKAVGAVRGFRVLMVVGLMLAIAWFWLFATISSFTPKNGDPYVRESSDTLSFRLCLWEGSRNLLLDRPLFGAGLSGFKELYSQRYFTCDAEPLEYPHNWVLNFWTETGILGLLGFLWILVVYFERVKRVEMVKRGMGAVFAAAMVYWLIHGLVDVPYFKNDLALEFWVFLALAETLELAF